MYICGYAMLDVDCDLCDQQQRNCEKANEMMRIECERVS